ncbi:MAG: hypothetical protein J5971_05355 [Prevotella sp.]|nr:hypothetical protein [Prevotella sp.]
MKKNYITPDVTIQQLDMEEGLLAGSLGSGETPQSQMLNALPETGTEREGNLAREVIYPENYNAWDD